LVIGRGILNQSEGSENSITVEHGGLAELDRRGGEPVWVGFAAAPKGCHAALSELAHLGRGEPGRQVVEVERGLAHREYSPLENFGQSSAKPPRTISRAMSRPSGVKH
jgi:hypothetical protein